MEASSMQVELREHDRRISGLHRTVGGLSTDVAGHKTAIEVSKRDIGEVKSDIADIKNDVAKGREEQKAEMTWIRRGLWAAAGTFMLFFVAVASLLLQISGGG